MPVNTIMGLFAKSPIKPLQQHMATVHQCCLLLVPFFGACRSQSWQEASEIREQISQLEHDADALKHKIRLNLPSGLFMPIERTDLLSLLSQQDKLANLAKDISGRILGRELQIPEPLFHDFMTYTKRCMDASEQALFAINELDELLEMGFSGRAVALVEKMIHQLDIIEDDTDDLLRNLCTQLMAIEDQYNAVDIIFLYKILESMGAIADQALRVGSRLELMLARS